MSVRFRLRALLPVAAAIGIAALASGCAYYPYGYYGSGYGYPYGYYGPGYGYGYPSASVNYAYGGWGHPGWDH